MNARQRPGRSPATVLGTSVALLMLLVYPLVTTGPAGPVDAPPVLAAAARPFAEGPGTPVPYYVVGQSVTGQGEYLYEIAERTLGDGDRYPEIFALNKDRVQADGGRLSDPTVLQPGWILQLPAGADGPGVLVGALPTAAVPAPTVSVPQPSIAASVARSQPKASGDTGLWLIRGGALLLMLVLLGAAVRALHSGRRKATDDPAPAAALVAAALPAPAAPPAKTMATRPAAAPAPPARPRRGGLLERASRSAPPAASTPPPASAVRQPSARPAVPARPSEPDAPGQPAGAPRHGWATAVLLPDWTAAEEPAAPVERKTEPLRQPSGSWQTQVLNAQVRRDNDQMTVRLAGARMPSRTPAYFWLAPGDPIPGATLPVILGENDQGRLCVDLALAPDVVTLSGPDDARARVARDLAGQLNGVPAATVTVVGEILGPDTPPGIRRVGTLAELTAAGGIDVLFCAGSRAELMEVRRLLTQPGQRLIPVIVGEAPAARWSLRIDPPATG